MYRTRSEYWDWFLGECDNQCMFVEGGVIGQRYFADMWMLLILKQVLIVTANAITAHYRKYKENRNIYQRNCCKRLYLNLRQWVMPIELH